MRILFIAPRFPFPADTGGKIRTFNILKQLAATGRVDLLCFSFDKKDTTQWKVFDEMGVSVTLIPAGQDSLIKKGKHILLGGRPYSTQKYFSQQMFDAVRALIEEHAYDLVHIDHIHMAHYLSSIGDLPAVVDEHNVEFRILERCADNEKNPLKRFVFSTQAVKMKSFERHMLIKAQAVTAVSEDDRQSIDHLLSGKTHTVVIPNGVDTQYFAPKAGATSEKEEALVFTGSMDWFPNDDAVLFFCRDILPLIWKKNPGVKFYVVGRGASPDLIQQGEKDERIVITGRVDDVRTFVYAAKVFVVPLRVGGGTRLKILEAMSMEKPVVSTSIGAEGIAHSPGQNILLADTPEEFSKKVLYLLADEKNRRPLEQNGRKLVLEKYDWPIIGRKLIQIYSGMTHE